MSVTFWVTHDMIHMQYVSMRMKGRRGGKRVEGEGRKEEMGGGGEGREEGRLVGRKREGEEKKNEERERKEREERGGDCIHFVTLCFAFPPPPHLSLFTLSQRPCVNPAPP